MNKIIPFMLLFFFISATFATAFTSVSASELVEDSWNTMAPMNHARAHLGVVAVDSKIYAIGGSLAVVPILNDGTLNASIYMATNECYDPKTNTWITLTSMPTPRYDFAIAAYEGKIYCIGGYGYTEKGLTYSPLTVNEAYDIATDSWSTKAAIPFSGGRTEAQVVDGKIFVIDEDLNTLFMYDPVTDLWITKTSMPNRGAGLALDVVEGKIIVTGKFYSNRESGVSRDLKVWIYTPEVDTWREGTAGYRTTDSFAAGATTGLYASQKFYVFCGDGATKATFVYDPVDDVWSTVKARPAGRWSFGVAVVDDVFYVIGGFTEGFTDKNPGPSPPSSLNEQYVPLGYQGALSSDPGSLLDNLVLVGVVVVAVAAVAVAGTLLFFFKNKGKK